MLYQRKRVEGVDDERLKFEVSTIVSREVVFFFSSICHCFLANIQKFEFSW